MYIVELPYDQVYATHQEPSFYSHIFWLQPSCTNNIDTKDIKGILKEQLMVGT
jgi:hypothetical protein